MVFNVYPSAQNLQPYIKGYIVADSTLSQQTGIHKLFPNGYSGIFLNFGKFGKIAIKDEFETPKISIYGQIDQSFDAIHLPGSFSLGILFEPTILSKFLRINMSELTNKAFDGLNIMSELGYLHEQIEETVLLSAKLELLNRYFTQKLIPNCLIYTTVDHAVQLINDNKSQSIKDLANTLGKSERYLETKFQNEVGLSPKTYSMIVRFKRIEHFLNDKSNARWGNMDFALEFYDQNHFIKNFKRFTGHTPSDYLLNNFEMGRSYLVK